MPVDVGRFAVAVIVQWWSVTLGALTLLGILDYFWGWRIGWRKFLYAAVPLLLVGAFFAWRDERDARLTAELAVRAGEQQPSSADVRPGTILATHYPTGELFAFDPSSKKLSLLSARLGEPSTVLVRPNGKPVVLDSQFGLVTEVDPKSGRHRDIAAVGLWGGALRSRPPLRPIGMVLESASSALVAAGSYIIRVNLDASASDPDAVVIAQLDGVEHPWGIAVDGPDSVIVSDNTGHRLVRKNLRTGEQSVLTQVRYPSALLREPSGSLLVGAHRDGKGVLLRVNADGSQALVAAGPFVTLAGLALDADGSILIADNGEGSPGNGFVARVRADNSVPEILIDAQISGWKFTNGRGVAVVPVR